MATQQAAVTISEQRATLRPVFIRNSIVSVRQTAIAERCNAQFASLAFGPICFESGAERAKVEMIRRDSANATHEHMVEHGRKAGIHLEYRQICFPGPGRCRR
jgi:hypothetical protein